MRIHTFGAAGEVTGSCYLVETGQARVLIDHGMHQGGREEWKHNLIIPPLDCPNLDAVLLTHAHIDHIGRLPLLTRCGYKGPIYATQATCELTTIMLRDAGHLQVADAERANQRRQRLGLPTIEPLYTPDDVEPVLALLKPVPYDQVREIARGVTVKWLEAGHILGSASLEMHVAAIGPRPARTVVFSGDIGPHGMPLLRDPAPPSKADLVFLESTYGDRDHRPPHETIDEFAGIIKAAIWAKQKVIIPAFAVGRTQMLCYHLATLVRAGRLPNFPVYVDSPMAVAAFELYRKHTALYDAEAAAIFADGHGPMEMPGAIFADGHGPMEMPGLRLVTTSEDSKKINTMPGAAVIIAASGMCTGGRILHHLRHNLWKRDTQVIIAGYQAEGSLGRHLVEGATVVRIMGDSIAVRAKINTLGGLSAHAGQSELLGWAKHFASGSPEGKWPRFVLTHGEPKPRSILAGKLRDMGAASVEEPLMGSVIEL